MFLAKNQLWSNEITKFCVSIRWRFIKNVPVTNYFLLKKKSDRFGWFWHRKFNLKVQNWHFWGTVTGWRHKIWYFHLNTVDSWPKTLLFRTQTACMAKSKYSLYRCVYVMLKLINAKYDEWILTLKRKCL